MSAAQPSQPAIGIRPLQLHEAHRARALFADALLNHFDYFDATYKQVVLADNSWWSMVKGVVHPRRILLVAKDNGRMLGYVIGSVPTAGHAQIYWLFVDPTYRGQNVGLALLSRMLKVMRAKGATYATLITHDHAKYYARQGFKLIDKVQDGPTTKYVLTYRLQ